MLRLLIALILCASYLVRDGMLADWSWDESIHHAAIEHEHTDQQSHEDEHRSDDCCLAAHSFIPATVTRDFVPAVTPLVTIHAPYTATYLPWPLAPPLRPPIA